MNHYGNTPSVGETSYTYILSSPCFEIGGNSILGFIH